jgi:hypothetical protein
VFARAVDADTGKYVRKALGDFGLLSGHDVFVAAKRDAEAWAAAVEGGALPARKIDTVAEACEAYVEQRPSAIASGVFRRHVFDDPIGKVRLDKLRRHHLLAWRKRLEDAPALVSRSKSGERRTKERSKATVNRDMVPVRAALGRVLVPGAPNTDAAWQEALRPYKGADKRRDLYLDRAERKRLLAATDESAAPFVRALCMLPLRPGALARLNQGDFEGRTRTLTIGEDKNGLPRQIAVPEVIAVFLASQVKGKPPSSPIFAHPDGHAWTKDSWKHPIKAAVDKRGCRQGFQRTVAPLRDHRSHPRRPASADGCATLGTSVAMIGRHYGHLVRNDAERALARLVL